MFQKMMNFMKFKELSGKICNILDEPDWHAQIIRFARASSPDKFVSKVGYFAKTHTDLGKMGFRLLHEGRAIPGELNRRRCPWVRSRRSEG